MRKLATIRKIKELKPIGWADQIELAVIDGWQVIVRKGEFKPGDLCVYCEIDSVLPDKPEFEFLRQKRFRIRTMKMRGTLSQGIAFPLSIVPASALGCTGVDLEGRDLTETLGVKLWEPATPITTGASIRGKFPPHVPKTDEERVQNLVDQLADWRDSILYRPPLYSTRVSFRITEKLDGCSATYMFLDGEFHVCSRNLDLQPSDKNVHWQIAKKYNIEEQLTNYCTLGPDTKYLAVQGEIIGPGIQKNRLKLTEHKFCVFTVFDIRAQRYFLWEETIALAQFLKLDTVPVIRDCMHDPLTVENVLKWADGQSLINPDVCREGVVFSNSYEEKDSQFNRISFKAISNKYLLKEK